MTDDELKTLEALCEKATPGPWETSVTEAKSTEEMYQQMAEHLSHSGKVVVSGVWCPKHPQTVIGGDPARPVHAVSACITGNGPNAPANAEFIAAARLAVPALIDSTLSARAERDKLRDQLHDADTTPYSEWAPTLAAAKENVAALVLKLAETEAERDEAVASLATARALAMEEATRHLESEGIGDPFLDAANIRALAPLVK